MNLFPTLVLLASVMKPSVALSLYLGLTFAKYGDQWAMARDVAQCPIDSPVSCSNPGADVDTCCFESPGGVLLQTQFWDYNPATGADDEWTLHGLWPDNCDGTYEQNCDPSLNIDGTVQSIVVGQFGDQALYDFMSKTWKNYNGDDESLWVHEFNKHGTCIRTLNPTCYGGTGTMKFGQNIYDFFRITVDLYKKLPTYQFLTAEGITPSTTNTYTKQQIADALNKHFGSNVYFKCDSLNALQEVWYFHHIKGSVLGENFIPIDTLSNSGCSASGIKWIPKGSSGGTPTTTGGSNPTGSPGTSGNIKVEGKSGCLISNGKYYESGTCATYTFSKATFGGWSLKSSKGYCGLDGLGNFACGSSFQSSDYQFNKDSSGNLGYGNTYDWCLGASEGSPAQTYVVNAQNGACDGQTTFHLLT